jgi:nucleotide-binding universal stress UspA family protein
MESIPHTPLRVLLALKPFSETAALEAHLESRFAGLSIELHVITIASSPAKAGEALVHLRAQGERLKQLSCVAHVRTQLDEGQVAEAINAAALRLRPSVVLLQKLQRKRLLSSLGLLSVTRQVCQQASYPVEVIKQRSAGAEEAYRVLIPMTEESLDLYPIEKLLDHPLPESSIVRFLALLPPQLDDGFAESSAIEILRDLGASTARTVRLESRLQQLCDALSAALDPSIRIDYQIQYESSSASAISESIRLGADLLVIPNQTADGFTQGVNRAMSPAAMLMAAHCSVLMLGHSLPRNFALGNRLLALAASNQQPNP